MNHETLRDALITRDFQLDTTIGSPARVDDVQRPWFVSLGLGIAGWVAGLCLLFFVWQVFDPDTALQFSMAGALLVGAAYGLYFADRDSAFFDQLALALSITGQFAFCVAAERATGSDAVAAMSIALLQLLLWLIMPNALARFLAAFFACIAWALALRFVWWGDMELANTRYAIAFGPAVASWLLIWLPIAAAAYLLIHQEAVWMAKGLQRWLRPGLHGLLLALAFGTWVSEPVAALSFVDTASEMNFLALWPLFGAAASLFSLGAAFLLRHRALMGAAIVAALLHVGHFYYVLGTSLRVKAAIMVISGAVLLAAAKWIGTLHEGDSD